MESQKKISNQIHQYECERIKLIKKINRLEQNLSEFAVRETQAQYWLIETVYKQLQSGEINACKNFCETYLKTIKKEKTK
jgi:hypothetical protein